MVENSRATLKEELALTLHGEDELLILTTQGFIDQDADGKLLKIDSVIKSMLDECDEKALQNSIKHKSELGIEV